jgi:hypothetical protein
MGMTRGRYLPGSSTDRILNSYKAVEFVPPQTAQQVAATEQVAAKPEISTSNCVTLATLPSFPTVE